MDTSHTWTDSGERRDFQDNDDLGDKDVEEWSHCEADVTWDRKGRLVAHIVEKEGGTDINTSVKKRTQRVDTKDVAPTTLIRLCSPSQP